MRNRIFILQLPCCLGKSLLNRLPPQWTRLGNATRMKIFFSGYYLQNYQVSHGAGYRSGLATLTTGDTTTHLNTPATKKQATKDRNFIAIDMSHGLHFVECHKVIKFNYHTLNLNTVLSSLKRGIVINLQARRKRVFKDNWAVLTQDLGSCKQYKVTNYLGK